MTATASIAALLDSVDSTVCEHYRRLSCTTDPGESLLTSAITWVCTSLNSLLLTLHAIVLRAVLARLLML